MDNITCHGGLAFFTVYRQYDLKNIFCFVSRHNIGSKEKRDIAKSLVYPTEDGSIAADYHSDEKNLSVNGK